MHPAPASLLLLLASLLLLSPLLLPVFLLTSLLWLVPMFIAKCISAAFVVAALLLVQCWR
jgi:hypothetical protein